jgi:hypothetical protein
VRRTTTTRRRPVTTTKAKATTTTTLARQATTTTVAPPVVADLVPGTGPGTAPSGAQGGGPWSTRVRLARSSDGGAFTPDATALVDQGGVPTLMTDAAGRTRVYYVDWPNGNVIAAAVENRPGVWAFRRVSIEGRPAGSSAVDPAVLLVDGVYRLWFMQSSGGRTAIHVASSPDGFAFRYDGLAYQPAGDIFDPTVLRLGGRYLMWAGPDGANAATSTDGLHFSPAPTLSFGGRPFMVWSAVLLPDGRGRVFGQLLGGSGGGPAGISSATSPDGVAWSLDDGLRLQGASDHGALRRPDGSWLIAYVDRF